MLRFLGWRNVGCEFPLFSIIECLVDQRPVQMLNREHFQDFNAVRHYLLDKTQHMIGGFGKLPDDPPGPYPSITARLNGISNAEPVQISYTRI